MHNEHVNYDQTFWGGVKGGTIKYVLHTSTIMAWRQAVVVALLSLDAHTAS